MNLPPTCPSCGSGACACALFSYPKAFNFCVMASSVRLQWLITELHKGRTAHVSFSFNAVTNKEKIKFVLGDSYCLKNIYRPCLLGAFEAAKFRVLCFVGRLPYFVGVPLGSKGL